MKKLVDRTEEKLELAKELGMYSWRWETQKKIKIKKDIENLTSMNFAPTTDEEIRKKLTKRVWHGLGYIEEDTWGDRKLTYAPPVISFLIPLAIVAIVGFVGAEHDVMSGASNYSIITGLMGLGTYCLTRFKKCDVKSISLVDWTDNIPYGAMLAVKEAKEKSLSNFKVYYPCKYADRIKTDPIITAQTEVGNMVEIFYWDDGKLYE